MLTRANAGKWSFLTLLQAEVAKIVKKQEKQPKAVGIPDGFLTIT